MTPEVILAVVNTNAREAMELSRGYIILYLLILLVMVLTYIYLVRTLPSRLPGRRSLYISLAAVGFFLLLPLLQKDDDNYPEKVKNTFFTTFPNSFIHDAGKVYLMYREMADNAEIRNHFKFRAQQVNAPGLKQIYILIIGESSRAVQWGINGYYRNTSPKLMKRTNLVSFSHTVAGAYATEYAVPQIISEAGPENFQLQNREKSIVSAFKEAGFKTYWMSNNLDYGHIQMHAKEADEFWYSIDSHPMDMDMVDKELRRVLDKNEDKVFIVIHTYGNHWSYFERYPPSYEIFKPVVKNIGIQHSDVAKKSYLINAYDNSILYSDALIDTVIGMTEKKNACSSVFFISDHGEDLLDDSREKFTHGSGPPSIYVAHIPLFIWYSDKLKETFPEKIKCLYIHKDRKTGTENIFPSLADMASLKFPSLDTTKSILNPAFTDSRQKIMGGDAKVYEYEKLY
jgi:glucan phosphoethanolaminetransferase (alkaline phosphatase superfamily)